MVDEEQERRTLEHQSNEEIHKQERQQNAKNAKLQVDKEQQRRITQMQMEENSAAQHHKMERRKSIDVAKQLADEEQASRILQHLQAEEEDLAERRRDAGKGYSGRGS